MAIPLILPLLAIAILIEIKALDPKKGGMGLNPGYKGIKPN